MVDKDVSNKVPIYKLKTTEEVMKYYDEWGTNNKYNQDMIDWIVRSKDLMFIWIGSSTFSCLQEALFVVYLIKVKS